MSKPHRPLCGSANWPQYNRALVRRGSMLILIDPELDWLAAPTGGMGRPAVFSNVAIQLCRRQKTLAVQISCRRAVGPLNLLVESTGIKFLGDGEWHARKQGPSRRRQRRKVHLAMGTATSDIRPVEFTSNREGDSPTLPALLHRIPEGAQIGSITADGAYDTRRCRTAILEHGAKAIIPIRQNGRLWREDCPAAVARNAILHDVRQEGRASWKRRNGYHVRSRAGATMRCIKAFGDRIAARDPDRRTAEIHIRVALMNRFSALGTADVVCVA